LKQSNLLERMRHEKDLAKLERYPDFELSALYSEEKASQLDRFVGAGLTFHIPLWNRNKGKITYYDSEITAMEKEKKYLENKIAADMDVFFIEYENKRKVIQSYPLSLIDKLHRQMAEADKDFRRGQVEILTFLELDQSSSELHAAIFESQMEYIRSYLKILEMSGNMNFQEEK
jgi:outer membrane protein TolC